jgi:hypothetical protein
VVTLGGPLDVSAVIETDGVEVLEDDGDEQGDPGQWVATVRALPGLEGLAVDSDDLVAVHDAERRPGVDLEPAPLHG